MHSKFKIAKYIVVFFLVYYSFNDLFSQTRFHNTISGRVTDADTGEPLFNVNVFLANTTRGAATDKDGYYLIKNILPGVYDLVFSMMGYELQIIHVQFTTPKSLKYNMKLRSRILKGKAVEVVAAVPKEWKKHLQRFITEFIGESENAKKCEILNPEVLDFRINKKTNYFAAATDSILVLENRSLGYRIHIILDTFRISEDSLIYATYPRYEELIPHDAKEKEKWLENRNRTYQGSFRHFISALACGKLEEENFVIFDLSGNYLSPSHLNVVPDTSLALKWFYFYEPLEVVYRGIYHAGEGKYFREWGGRFPSSYLYVKKGYALIDTLGNVLTKFAFIHSGYWYRERMADMLPFDYLPGESL